MKWSCFFYVNWSLNCQFEKTYFQNDDDINIDDNNLSFDYIDCKIFEIYNVIVQKHVRFQIIHKMHFIFKQRNNFLSFFVSNMWMSHITYFQFSYRLMFKSRIWNDEIMIRIEISNVWILKKFQFMNETFVFVFKQTFFDIIVKTNEILILT